MGQAIPISSIVSLKSSRSSVISIPLIWVPRTLTPYFSRAPFLASPTPQLRAVCPPNPRSMASGLSFSMTSVTNSGLTGRK